MDDRDRRQVEIGAGLQESRLNTELIEWLQKWGPRALYVLLAVVLGYLGWTKWTEYRQNQIDEAFAVYHAEVASQNPDVLLTVAQEHDGKGAVWTLATLDAAEILLRSARLGIEPGANTVTPTEDQTLSEQRQQTMFASSLQHYESVLERHRNNPKRDRFAQEARWGIVSASISMGDLDRARTMLQEYIEVADRNGFSLNAVLGRQRLEMLDSLVDPIPVYSAAELPESNRPLDAQAGGYSVNTGAPTQVPGITLPGGANATIEKIDPSELRRTDGTPINPPTSTTDPPAPETQADEPATDDPE